MASSSTSTSMRSLRVRASWDLNPSPILTNPNANRAPKVVRLPPPSPPLTVDVSKQANVSPTLRKEELPAAVLWNTNRERIKRGELDEQHMGYERWLPVAPKVKKPRSIYNSTSLAYLGDCIYELYARRHFLSPTLSIDVYNERVMSIVRCEAQDLLLTKLFDEDYLTEDERDVLRWGKNIASSKTRARKRAGIDVYNRASSLETLIGFLYLTDMKRLETLMYKLGFSTGIPIHQSSESTKST